MISGLLEAYNHVGSFLLLLHLVKIDDRGTCDQFQTFQQHPRDQGSISVQCPFFSHMLAFLCDEHCFHKSLHCGLQYCYWEGFLRDTPPPLNNPARLG